MNINTFIATAKLQPADCLAVKKQSPKLLDHYLVYLGTDGHAPMFLANYTNGTKLMSKSELATFSKDFTPDLIFRFIGNALQRKSAVERALDRKDFTSYHLILNNCRSFSSTLQIGKQNTDTSILGKGLLVTGLITAATCKKPEAQAAGLFAAILGLMTLTMED